MLFIFYCFVSCFCSSKISSSPHPPPPPKKKRKKRVAKAANSESNEGRYYRIFSVLFYYLCLNLFFFLDKPKVTIPVVRTVPGHMVKCSADGTRPINMSLIQNFTILDQRTDNAVAKVTKEGNATCVAKNQAGTDSMMFSVSGVPFLLFSFVIVFSFGN